MMIEITKKRVKKPLKILLNSLPSSHCRIWGEKIQKQKILFSKNIPVNFTDCNFSKKYNIKDWNLVTGFQSFFILFFKN